ncbi:MAG TPA: dihydrolipoamide acetyltransferase family protein [Paludibacter sp.]|nr:dihydrolipoamide acetyltransferase family protein [Paludibacter sp.]
MRYIFNFPDIGEGLDEGTILEWHVIKGQTIKAGQALVNMETDKIVTDIPSPKSGTIVALFGSVGETIHVGSPLVEIEIEGIFGADAVAEAKEQPKVESIEEAAAGVVGTMELAGSNAYLPASDEGSSKEKTEEKPVTKALATPLARVMAKELNIDINKIIGSGPSGRVTKEDIENYKQPKATAKETKQKDFVVQPFVSESDTYEALSQIRKAIAKNMLNSKQSTAHMTLFEEVEISELISIREKFKLKFAEKDVKLTYLPFIVKATVEALKQHRQLNSQIDLENERMIYKNQYNIGIAVDTPEGLVVPVIKNADRLSILQIAQKISELSEKAKDRKLSLDDMKDGTFTLTNYGSIGGIFATPVINFPQAGILGIGRIVKKPVVNADQIVVGNVLPLSLSVDHRIVDGGDASRFINRIMAYLSDPIFMFME